MGLPKATDATTSTAAQASRVSHQQTFFSASKSVLTRQVVVQILTAITGILLARLASPTAFGQYVIIGFSFLLLLAPGDLGLGACLIRQQRSPTPVQLRQVLTVRHAVDLLLGALVFFSAPYLASLYNLGPHGHTALLFVWFAVFVQSFQIIPMIMLERGMAFNRIARIEILQTAVFATLIIVFTTQGLGVLGFAIAWLGFALTGSILASMSSPWRIAWTGERQGLRRHLGFALPFQLASAATLARDGVTPVLIGLLLGASAVGYLNWAQMLALTISLAILAMQRICFAGLSRVKNDKTAFRELLNLSVAISSAVVAFPSVLILFFAESITVFVFGTKWLAALPLFYALWPINYIAAFVPVVIGGLHALGKATTVLHLSVIATLVFWASAIVLVPTLGIEAYPPSLMLYYLCSLMMLLSMKEFLSMAELARASFPIWILALACGIFSVGIAELLRSIGFAGIILGSLLGGILYLFLLSKRYVSHIQQQLTS